MKCSRKKELWRACTVFLTLFLGALFQVRAAAGRGPARPPGAHQRRTGPLGAGRKAFAAARAGAETGARGRYVQRSLQGAAAQAAREQAHKGRAAGRGHVHQAHRWGRPLYKNVSDMRVEHHLTSSNRGHMKSGLH